MTSRQENNSNEETIAARLVEWDEFWSTPDRPREWIVDPFVGVGGLTLTFAPAKAGKSLLALEAAVAVATGGAFLGVVHEPADVLYIDMEMTRADLRSRLTTLGVSPDVDLSRLHYVSLAPWAAFDTPAGGQQLLDHVTATGARLVIVDTVSKCLDGDENDARTLVNLYRCTLLPLRRRGTAAWLQDHAGKDPARGARGSSAKSADVDAVWSLTSRGTDRLTARRTHTRHPDGPGVLYLRRAMTEDGLRHLTDTVNPRGEDRIARCLANIADLDPSADASRNEVADLLREANHKHSNDTISAAYTRWASA
jgi:hypothetical protein